MKFAKLLFIMLFLSVVTIGMNAQLHAQDTTFFGSTGHDVGVSKTLDFRKDSTQATVTNWIDATSFNDKNIYLSHTYSDLYFGRTTGNDTMRCIVQGQDAAGNIFNLDTVGTGSEGSEKLISTETATQYLVSLKKFTSKIRLYFANLNTAAYKNGRGRYVGALFAVPTHLK